VVLLHTHTHLSVFNTDIGWSHSCKVVERMENKTPGKKHEKWVVSSRQQLVTSPGLESH